MAVQAITLRLPSQIYSELKRRADARHHSVEAELLEVVTATVPKREDEFPEDLEAEVSALAELTDQALWQIARDHLPEETAVRLEELNLKKQREGLTAVEERTVEKLLEGYERIMVMRAEAAAFLKQRGHDVSGLLVRG